MFSRLVAFLLNPRARLRPQTPTKGDEPTRPRARLSWRDILFNLPLLLGGLVVLALLLVVLFGPLWTTYDPHITALSVLPHFDAETNEMIRPPFVPSPDYPLGTDNWGNDMLGLLLHGARVTLVAVFFITLGRILLGTFLGSLAGWFAGRWPDQAVTALIAVITSLPILLSSYILIFALDIRKGLPVFLIALSITGWTEIAQVVRSELLVIRRQLYVEAAVATGLRGRQILIRHVLPNILPQLLVVSFLEMSAALLLLAELGFLGVFVGGGSSFSMGELMAPPTPIPLPEVPEWGMLISQGVNSLRAFPHKLLAPALTVFVAVMGLNSFGEGLRTLLDKASVNTSFLLRWWMVLVGVGLAVFSWWIIDATGPNFSYERVALTFAGDRAETDADALMEMGTLQLDAAGHNERVVYLAEQLTAAEWDGGWREGFVTAHFYPQPTGQMWSRPQLTPTLTLLDEQGQPQLTFIPETDFGFVLQGHGGGGAVTAPLMFVGQTGATVADWGDLTVRGRIAVLQEGNLPATFATEALRRGALAVLWLTPETTVNSEMVFASDAAANYLRRPSLPIIRLNQSASAQLLQAAGMSASALLLPDAQVTQQGEGWLGREWPVQIAIELTLPRPQALNQTSLIAFKSGYGMGLAHEVVVVVVCDPALRLLPEDESAANLASTALLLELARVWQANQVNSLRSILLIQWAGTPAEAQTFLADPENFARLNPMLPSAPLQPAYVLYVDTATDVSGGLWADPASDLLLLDILKNSSAALEVPVSTNPADPLAAPTPITLEVPVLYLRWSPDGTMAYSQTGQVLSLSLLKLVRQIVIKP